MALGVGAAASYVASEQQNEVVETKAVDDTSTWKIIGTINGHTYTKSNPYATEPSVSANTITCNLAFADTIQLYYSDLVIVGGSVLNRTQNKPYDTSKKSRPDPSSSYFSSDSNAKVYRSGTYVFNVPANYAEYGDKTYGIDINYTPTTVGSWTGATARLYFVPAFSWKTYDYSSNWIDPSLYYQWENGKYSNASWGTSMAVPTGHDGKNYYYWDNVPLTELAQITILFNKGWASDNPPRIDFSATSRLEWFSNSDGHQKNVFGTLDDGWHTGDGSSLLTMGGGRYIESKSYTFVAGSVAECGFPSWNDSPFDETILAGSTAPYSLLVPFTIGDQFKLVTYTGLSNTSTSGNAASWSLGQTWKSYGDLTFKIYDDCVDSETQVASGNVSQYISEADGGNIKINHAGDVTVSVAAVRGTEVTLRWSSTSSRSFTPSSTLPNRVVGTFNNSSTSSHQIAWTPETGRYESLCAFKASENFRYANGSTKISISTLVPWNSEDISVSTTSPGTANITVNTNTDFYSIGWYYENTTPGSSPTKSVIYFIDRTAYFTGLAHATARCAEALCKKLELYTTCDVTNANALALQSLYNACTYSSKTTYMSSYSFDDYSYESWHDNGESYSGLTKDSTTNAKTKYEWLLYMGGVTDVRPASASFIPSSHNSDSPLTTTLWIVLASGLAGLAAIGTAYFVSKKKSIKPNPDH